jgi:hypothetical protein
MLSNIRRSWHAGIPRCTAHPWCLPLPLHLRIDLQRNNQLCRFLEPTLELLKLLTRRLEVLHLYRPLQPPPPTCSTRACVKPIQTRLQASSHLYQRIGSGRPRADASTSVRCATIGPTAIERLHRPISTSTTPNTRLFAHPISLQSPPSFQR